MRKRPRLSTIVFLGNGREIHRAVVKPLGWDWKIGVATLASFPAREVIIANVRDDLLAREWRG